MSDYKKYLLDKVGEMSEEDFTTLVERFDRLNGCLEDMTAILQKLGLGDPTESPVTKAESLCVSCAKPCAAKSDETVVCKDYNEFIEEKCPTCEYWDVEICMFNGTCVGGDHYFEKGKLHV